MKKYLQAGIVIGYLLAAADSQAATYVVDYKDSKVTFSGTHADNKFIGTFDKWSADIEFDRASLEKSHIKAVFDLKSAHTGNSMFDGTLPEVDWFNVQLYPQGVFESTSIIAIGGNDYRAKGNLTLHGITQPIELTFSLSDIKKKLVEANATLTLNRLAYDIGKKSDPEAEWVSKDIAIVLKIVAAVK